MVAMTSSLNWVIFTDCRAVWQGIVRLQKEGWNELFWLRSPDSDLWRSAWRILPHPDRILQVEWLESHRNLSSARGASDAWKIFHNGHVDKDAAFQANPLQPHIQAIHEQLVQQNQNLERRRREVIVFLKTIWNAHAAKEPRQGAHG